jgi:DNA-binding LytR/AlgR family response regulator
LSEIFYFEVVDDRSFVYTKAKVFEAKEKLYEFERLCEGSTLFRSSKSMVLNAENIDYVRPSLSGRFEAVLSNGEKVVVSRKYVADLKRMLGV